LPQKELVVVSGNKALKGVILAAAIAMPLALLLADAEDRKERVVGGVHCIAISHINDPVWDGKSWYMSGWGCSEAERAIDEIALTSTLRIEWLKLHDKDSRSNAARAYTSIGYMWCPPWQEVCYESKHTFKVGRDLWEPFTCACIVYK
jgi:hypothetical protein